MNSVSSFGVAPVAALFTLLSVMPLAAPLSKSLPPVVAAASSLVWSVGPILWLASLSACNLRTASAMSASVAFGNERTCCAGSVPLRLRLSAFECWGAGELVRLRWVAVDATSAWSVEAALADSLLELTREDAGAVGSTMLQFEGE